MMFYYILAGIIVIVVCVLCGALAYKKVSANKDTGARTQLVNSDISTGLIYESIEFTNYRDPDTWRE